jgi:hypothetical protein
MSVCLVINIPGATLEQYDEIRRAIVEPLGEGQISHVVGATQDGICVVDVWESREQFDRFLEQQLGEQLGRAGVSQPQVTEFEVHTSERRD